VLARKGVGQAVVFKRGGSGMLVIIARGRGIGEKVKGRLTKEKKKEREV